MPEPPPVIRMVLPVSCMVRLYRGLSLSREAFGYSASGSSTSSAELSVTQAVWKYLICGSMP